jgi:hypothetical protein
MALAPQHVNVRVFLASFMIAYFPANVFENMGPLEKALFDVATPLIECFELITGAISRGIHFKDVKRSMTKDFTTLLYNYLCHFKAWKVPDEKKLVARIQHALVALYDAHGHLPPNESRDSKLNIEFRTQIGRLRIKLVKIAGQETLDKFDEGRAALPQGIGGQASTVAPARMTNEKLAHELLLDPSFQLNEDGQSESEVFKKVRQTFHEAFWNSLAEDLRLDPPCFVRVLRVLEEVRSGLHDVSKEHDAIDTKLDLVDLKERTDAGTYTWPEAYGLVGSVVSIIQRSEEDKRHAETIERFAVITDAMQASPACPNVYCKGLEFLLNRVNAMRIDSANARLRTIAPVIRDGGIEYERGKFKDKLDANQISLERTTAWLRSSMDNGESDNVVTAAILNLVSTSKIITPETCPETLLLDVDHIQRFQEELHYIVTSATVLIRAGHVAGMNDNLMVLSSQLAQKVDIYEAASATLKNVDVKAILRQASDKEDPVYKLMGCRIRTQFTKVLNGMTTDPSAFPVVLREIFPLIAKSASEIKRVADVCKLVHGSTFDVIIGQHIKKRKPSANPRA